MPDMKTAVDSREENVHTLSFDERVIKKIAGIAATEIPGILAMSGSLFTSFTDMLKASDDPTKGISVEVGQKQVAVDMNIVCEYGRNLPEIFDTIVASVSGAIKDMTGLEVVEMNVRVADILLKEDFERRKRAAEKVVKDEMTDAPLPMDTYDQEVSEERVSRVE